MRMAMTLLNWPESETRRLGRSIHELRDRLRLCARCGGLTDEEICPICSDASRLRDILCLTAEWDAMMTIDEGGFYHGQFMILGGLLAPLEKRDSSALNLDRLMNRLAENEIKELVLALGATLEAENTASFIRQLVGSRFPAVRITRLAQGIPLGSEVKYMDKETLRQSLKYRQDI